MNIVRLATVAVTALISAALLPAAPAGAALPTCSWHTLHEEAYVPSVSTTNGSVNCVMGQGAQSTAVFQLQVSLNYCYGNNLGQDGIFGPLTRAALINAQRQAGAVADGVYGPETRSKMLHRAIGPIFGCKHVS